MGKTIINDNSSKSTLKERADFTSKLSYYYPKIYQCLIDDYDINNIKEGVIVKYKAGECKCIVTKISKDVITINDNSHCLCAERKIKTDDFVEKMQIVKFLKQKNKWQTKNITTYKDIDYKGFIIDQKGELWRVGSIIEEQWDEYEEGTMFITNKENDCKKILERELIERYKKVLNIEFY